MEPLPMTEHWSRQAACVGKKTNIWFPAERGQTEASEAYAKAICRTCPVINECLQQALESPNGEHGVWGGTNEDERKSIRRRMNRGQDHRHAPKKRAKCGTEAGYNSHMKWKEVPCPWCQAAADQARAMRRQAAS